MLLSFIWLLRNYNAHNTLLSLPHSSAVFQRNLKMSQKVILYLCIYLLFLAFFIFFFFFIISLLISINISILVGIQANIHSFLFSLNNYIVGCLGRFSRLSIQLQLRSYLTIHGFEPHVGLCDDSLEPGACFRFCVSLFLCSSPTGALPLSLKNE